MSDEDIQAEMDAQIRDRMALTIELVRLGCIGPLFTRQALPRRRGARGRARSVKWSMSRANVVIKTYGRPMMSDSEGDLYQAITGHRPAWEKS